MPTPIPCPYFLPFSLLAPPILGHLHLLLVLDNFLHSLLLVQTGPALAASSS
jgi:hypothetical protein